MIWQFHPIHYIIQCYLMATIGEVVISLSVELIKLPYTLYTIYRDWDHHLQTLLNQLQPLVHKTLYCTILRARCNQ